MGDVRRAAALYRDTNADPVEALPRLRHGASDPDDLVRHMAAVQLAFHHPRALPEAVARELLGTLGRVSRASVSSSLISEYTRATDDGEDCWDLGQHIALALARLPAGSGDFAVPELVALWQRDRQFYEVALAAVSLSFPEGGRPTASALSELQQSVLVALTGDDAVWTFCMPTAPLLAARGLPTTRHGMQAFLDGTGG
ncbi:hypothetical protein [Limnoglobus roseus]|uniref:HEAT repeat domain-containing protein n=1 Tax=Limnoglobus roseus TaxID=2598579 RepID=A0A5C1AS00_9BACT|nr:hypothetical protein [Limnoglobus roseus]QEL20927.1 hypothetical protein PX52LOC_08051 [Limnoglobus roseus]